MAPRNVLFLMTDQHRVDTLGCYGNPLVKTPALDALAAEGTRFDRFYTPTAICTPARASLATGLHPFRHGMLNNPERNGGSKDELDDESPMLWRQLMDHGYQVGHAGKWHIGRERGPEFYGMDGEHLPGALNPVHHPSYEKWLEDNGFPPFAVTEPVFGAAANGTGRGHLIAGRLQQPPEATIEAFLTDRTLGLLDRYAADWKATGRPFMLSCHWYGPHLPYLIPDHYYDMYDPDDVPLPASMAETFAGKPAVQRQYSAYWSSDGFDAAAWRKLIAVYWGYVTMIDHQVGRILAALDDHGLRDGTAVFFTADHGEFTGAHRLNDKGPAMYEDIYRIPAIARVPGAPAQVCDAFANLIDLNPTILELAGAPLPDRCDGQSLLPLLHGGPSGDTRDEIVAEFHGHHFPYAQRMLRDRRYKLVHNPESVHELYDLETDPHELHNVYEAPAYAGIRRDLTVRLYRELLRRGDPAYSWMSYMADIGGDRAPDVDGVAEEVA
ncbi:sulfatase-like hydrolase/transferase [Streptomyces sp. NPDC090052]|uniref:sulfatase-like hydrolase/transferase n=1 Tax=unclassified Streptomyces TaxID=2593676 RepID=UPI00225675F6|nr:sulfatase-like hydrolase/transferase [Streptomyces sp. NBC_01306]MCX4728756.1 sulfatase-like hydrolase/transferase [Streptomyces sp. NBC_01306]WSV08440.1 sulfatase-like hydrolase/transferase [Streptomyces sp. NBC_01020]WSX46518.1 sulfatase-like hydrolase/transferase [Streptomyces sp. NBC_00963]